MFLISKTKTKKVKNSGLMAYLTFLTFLTFLSLRKVFYNLINVPLLQSRLDLDCVIDTEKIIQLWIGYMTKQLLDNNINITDAPEYIEKTLIGSVKLWFANLTENSKKVLRTNKPFVGGCADLVV